MAPLTQLPTELLVHILSYLPPTCLANIAETSRVLNTVVTHSDSLWEALCRPLPGHAPYESWRELYVTVWHNWGWLVGLWCGEHRHTGRKSHEFPLIAGCLMIGRYNDKNGLIDCHVLPLPVECIDPLGDSPDLDRRRVSLFEGASCISVPFQSNNPTPTRPRILPPESQANTSRLRKRPRRPNDETRSCDSPKQEFKRTR
jgi:F-box-like